MHANSQVVFARLKTRPAFKLFVGRKNAVLKKPFMPFDWFDGVAMRDEDELSSINPTMNPRRLKESSPFQIFTSLFVIYSHLILVHLMSLSQWY